MTGSDIGRVGYPTRADRELRAGPARSGRRRVDPRARELRLVLDYAYSPASLVVPAMIGDAGGRADRAQRVRRRRGGRRAGRARDGAGADRPPGTAVGRRSGRADRRRGRADLAGRRDRRAAGRRDHAAAAGRELSALGTTRARCWCRSPRRGWWSRWSTAAPTACSAPRRRCSSLLAAAADAGVVFAGASGGGYVFPAFLPAYDAVDVDCGCSRCSPTRWALSDLAAGCRQHARARVVHCPWDAKGAAMRRLIEAARGCRSTPRRAQGVRGRGLGAVLPDPDEPVFHI